MSTAVRLCAAVVVCAGLAAKVQEGTALTLSLWSLRDCGVVLCALVLVVSRWLDVNKFAPGPSELQQRDVLCWTLTARTTPPRALPPHPPPAPRARPSPVLPALASSVSLVVTPKDSESLRHPL